MPEVKVYINNVEADVESSEKAQIASTFSISDIRDISLSTSTTTKTITLPATENNRIIFGFAEDVTSLNAFSNSEKVEGRIEVDGSTVVQGAVKNAKSVIEGGKGITSYKINILSGVADWKFLMSDKNLRDLDFSEYNHTYNLVNQKLSEIITGALGGLDDEFLVYPLLNYGDTDGKTLEVTVKDRKPAFNVGRILDKMFNDIGFTISSAFRDSPYFSRLYIPFTSEKLIGQEGAEIAKEFFVGMNVDSFHGTFYTKLNSGNFPDPVFKNQDDDPPLGEYLVFTDNISFNDETSAGFFDNPSDFTPASSVPNLAQNLEIYGTTAGGFYTASTNTKQKFTAHIEGKLQMVYAGLYEPVGVLASIKPIEKVRLNLSITVNGGKIVAQDVTMQADPLIEGSAEIVPFSTDLETEEELIYVGDVVQVRMEYHISSNPISDPIIISSEFASSVTIDTNSTFNNQVFLDLQEGNPLDVATSLPDIEQILFIQSLKHLFNLYFYTDVEERTVYIEPRDDFYSTTAIDWIDKLDHSSPIGIEYLGQDYHRKIRYRYQVDDKDEGLKRRQELDETGAIIASHLTTIDNIFGKDGINENANQIFAPTIMDNGLTQLNMHTSKLPKLWKAYVDEDIVEGEPEFSTNFTRRILYYNGITNLLATELYFNVSIKGETTFSQAAAIAAIRTTYPYMYSVDVDNTNDNSLYFNTTDKSHGLFEKYYRNTIKTINEGRIISCSMYLTPTDIANLDFRVPVFIEIGNENIACTINKIVDYNPAKEGVTVVELLTVVASEQLTVVTNSIDTITTRTIQKRTRNKQLKTKDDVTGNIVNVFTIENGNIVPVFE